MKADRHTVLLRDRNAGTNRVRHTMREADRYTEIEPRIQAYERQDRGLEKVQNHIEFLKAITQRKG